MRQKLLYTIVLAVIKVSLNEECDQEHSPVLQFCTEGSISTTTVYLNASLPSDVGKKVSCTCHLSKLGTGTKIEKLRWTNMPATCSSNITVERPLFSSSDQGKRALACSNHLNVIVASNSAGSLDLTYYVSDTTSTATGFCVKIFKAFPDIYNSSFSVNCSKYVKPAKRPKPKPTPSSTAGTTVSSHFTSNKMHTPRTDNETFSTTKGGHTPRSGPPYHVTGDDGLGHSKDTEESGNTVIIIIIAAAGGVVLTSIIIIIIVCCIRYRRRRREKWKTAETERMLPMDQYKYSPDVPLPPNSTLQKDGTILTENTLYNIMKMQRNSEPSSPVEHIEVGNDGVEYALSSRHSLRRSMHKAPKESQNSEFQAPVENENLNGNNNEEKDFPQVLAPDKRKSSFGSGYYDEIGPEESDNSCLPNGEVRRSQIVSDQYDTIQDDDVNGGPTGSACVGRNQVLSDHYDKIADTDTIPSPVTDGMFDTTDGVTSVPYDEINEDDRININFSLFNGSNRNPEMRTEL